ncbi:MAG TPA: hypothetical protein VGJ54_01630 [Streptosporangiaceae bacterium]
MSGRSVKGRAGIAAPARARAPLAAGCCPGFVYDEGDPILEVLLTRCVYHRDFQLVAADTEIGR